MVRIIPIECKFGPTSAYAYYIDAPEPALIDTGIASSAENEIAGVLRENGFQIEDIQWILLTHGHVDHLGGAHAVWEKTGRRAEVVIPKKEAYLLRNHEEHISDYKNLQGKYVDEQIQQQHISILLQDIGDNVVPTREVEDGHRLSLGGDVTVTVIETPGHSIGSVTYLLDGNNWAFTGDAVQIFGGARSGMPTIEYPALYRQSVRHLLENIKPERLYVGHHFRHTDGSILSSCIDGEDVAAVLKASLDLDAKIVEMMERHLSNSPLSGDDGGKFGPFAAIADEIGYIGNPSYLPCAFFVTMNGYREELVHRQTVWEEEITK